MHCKSKEVSFQNIPDTPKCPKCPSEAHLWEHLSFLHRFLNILRIIYLLLQQEVFCYWQAAFLSDKTLHGLNEREEMLSGLCLKTALFKTASFLLISVPAVIKDEPPLLQKISIRDRKTLSRKRQSLPGIMLAPLRSMPSWHAGDLS